MDNTKPRHEPNDADIEYAKAEIRRTWTPAIEQQRMCAAYRNPRVVIEPVRIELGDGGYFADREYPV